MEFAKTVAEVLVGSATIGGNGAKMFVEIGDNKEVRGTRNWNLPVVVDVSCAPCADCEVAADVEHRFGLARFVVEEHATLGKGKTDGGDGALERSDNTCTNTA